MIDLQSFDPVFYWSCYTIDAHKAYNQERQNIWTEDPLESTVVTNSSIRFDAPKSWGWDNEVLKFHCDDDGLWRAEPEDGYSYEAARSDTATHTILTGIWKDPGYRGAFIAVFPKPGLEG